MKASELYIGLDVHKDSTTIAIADPGPEGEIRVFGTVSSDIDRLEKLRRMAKAHPTLSWRSPMKPARLDLYSPAANILPGRRALSSIHGVCATVCRAEW